MDIKKALKRHNLTVADTAAKLGVDRVTLSRTINGNPTINTLMRISQVTGIPIAEFFAEDNTPSLTCPHCGKPIVVKIRVDGMMKGKGEED